MFSGDTRVGYVTQWDESLELVGTYSISGPDWGISPDAFDLVISPHPDGTLDSTRFEWKIKSANLLEGTCFDYYEDGRVETWQSWATRVRCEISPSSEPIKDIFRLEDKKRENEVKPYAPSLIFRILSDDGLLVANDAEYKFYWHDANGGLARMALTDYRPVTFTAADKERYLKALTEDGGPPPRDQAFVFPDKYPPIDHMISDDHDNIFVRTYDTDKEGRHYFEAFSKNGKPLGRFPLGFNVSCFVGNKMYSLERDDNGFDRICRYSYRIVK